MAKYYGMKLTDESNVKLGIEWELDTGDDWNQYKGNYYIRPDSLHLLEMRIGDFVEMKNGFPRKLDADSVNDKEFNAKIIQRNGQPFMWPEVEND